jgi:hypothetical protein
MSGTSKFSDFLQFRHILFVIIKNSNYIGKNL